MSGIRLRWGLAFALAAVIALPASAASAATCTTPPPDIIEPSCFEAGDGNLVVDNAADGRIDWATVTGEETNTDGTGATDSRFVSGSKEVSPLTWNLESGSSPAKIDLLASASLVETVASNFYLYGAFERQPPANIQTGDANLAFELNKIAGLFDIDSDATTAAVPKRSEGDLLITFDGQADPRIGMCIWHGDELGQRTGHLDYGWYTLPGFGQAGSVQVDSNTQCTELNVVAEPRAFGQMNVGTVLDNSAPYIPDFSPSLANSTFGEIAVNVSLALSTLQNPTPCLDFGQIWLHTRTAESVTSTMADFVTPVPIQKGSTCSLTVDKKVAVNDPNGTYHDGTPQDPSYASDGDTLYYTLAVHNDGATPIAIDSVLDGNCSGPTIAPADKRANNGADPDATPATFDPDDLWTYRCSHVLAPGDAEPYVNTVTVNGHAGPGLPGFPVTDTDSASTGRLATLVVRKNQVGGSDAQKFAFTSTANLDPSGSFDLSEADGDLVFAGLVPNVNNQTAYSVTEASPQNGYVLDQLVCDDNDSVETLATGTADVKLSPGEKVICTFRNQAKGTVEVVKDLYPSSDSGVFDLQIDGTTEFNDAADGNTTGAVTVNAGLHNVGEIAGNGNVSLGDYISSISCANGQTIVASGAGSGPLNVTVGPGDAIVCMVRNEHKATIVVRKETLPAQQPAVTLFGFTSTFAGAFGLHHGEQLSTQVAPGAYQVSEDDPSALSYKLSSLTCEEDQQSNSTTSLAQRSASVQADPGETITCTFVNRLVTSQLVVVKAGNLTAYHGDQVTYTFTVTPSGTSALHNVSVTDDRCSPVSATPAIVQNDDGDALLEPVGLDGINPEVWVFTCTMTIGPHTAGEDDPIVNTATVSALDELDRIVTDTDQHSTDLLHVGIDLQKTGPATATAGDAVTYTLTATNTGDTAMAQPLVVVTDALCETPPARTSVNGDASPASFDPGDKWTYTCTVQTTLGQTQVVNVAVATGTDVNGRTAGDDARATTVLTQPPVVAPPVVQGEIFTPSSAKLRGPEGCPSGKTATLVVTGKPISSVTFRLDGRLLRTVRKADSKGRWKATVKLRAIHYGAHRVQALIRFRAPATPRTKTLHLAFSRCRPQLLLPKFTG